MATHRRAAGHADRARPRPPTRSCPAALPGEVALRGRALPLPGHRGDEALRGRRPRHRARARRVALVGETGAGKSTHREARRPLLRPDRRPGAGRRRRPSRDLDLGAYRRQLGVVPQEAFLFTGTIRDNIAYGRPDATDAEVEAAARAVGAHDFIAALPGGYLHAGQRAGPVAVVGPAPARSRWPGPTSSTRRSCCSTRRRRTSTSPPRPGCSGPCGVVAAGRTTILIAHRLQTAAHRRPHRRDRRRPRRRGRHARRAPRPRRLLRRDVAGPRRVGFGDEHPREPGRAGRGPEAPHRGRHLRRRPADPRARRRGVRHLRALDDGPRHDHLDRRRRGAGRARRARRVHRAPTSTSPTCRRARRWSTPP